SGAVGAGARERAEARAGLIPRHCRQAVAGGRRAMSFPGTRTREAQRVPEYAAQEVKGRWLPQGGRKRSGQRAGGLSGRCLIFADVGTATASAMFRSMENRCGRGAGTMDGRRSTSKRDARKQIEDVRFEEEEWRARVRAEKHKISMRLDHACDVAAGRNAKWDWNGGGTRGAVSVVCFARRIRCVCNVVRVRGRGREEGGRNEAARLSM
ncbi:hypothetical protein CSPAE12_08330, partial [Colletotrichum incanum]